MKNCVVKKSMFEKILEMVLPFYCRGCGKVGAILCDECWGKIELIGKVTKNKKIPSKRGKIELGDFDALFVGGFRTGALKVLLDDYKFKSVKKIGGVLAEIIDNAIGVDLDDVVVVPLPTIRKHIRIRGFDHARRLAEELSSRHGWSVALLLKRVNKTVQVGADEETRQKQAAQAYAVDWEKAKEEGLAVEECGSENKSRILCNKKYLLLDDVWTTGSSMRAAAKKLREAGAEKIYGAVVEITSNQASGQ
ncbi:ComF family protein [Candidatus Saccharibacteria bacterium]|nr:ComF family protein [Candidatus Saccharibacteria bacterium]